MKILVPVAAGYIGSVVTEELIRPAKIAPASFRNASDSAGTGRRQSVTARKEDRFHRRKIMAIIPRAEPDRSAAMRPSVELPAIISTLFEASAV